MIQIFDTEKYSMDIYFDLLIGFMLMLKATLLAAK